MIGVSTLDPQNTVGLRGVIMKVGKGSEVIAEDLTRPGPMAQRVLQSVNSSGTHAAQYMLGQAMPTLIPPSTSLSLSLSIYIYVYIYIYIYTYAYMFICTCISAHMEICAQASFACAPILSLV